MALSNDVLTAILGAEWKANDAALLCGSRLLSAYNLHGRTKTMWIVTEGDRSATTILLPAEY